MLHFCMFYIILEKENYVHEKQNAKSTSFVKFHIFKGLQNIFETLHDLNDSDEKTKMLKNPS